MIQATTRVQASERDDKKSGTYIYALYCKEKVVYVGQCADIHAQIDELLVAGTITFDRFTSTFLEDVQPYSDLSNKMETIAVSRLMPSGHKRTSFVKVACQQPSAGQLIYRLEGKNYTSGSKAPSLLPWKKMLRPANR